MSAESSLYSIPDYSAIKSHLSPLSDNNSIEYGRGAGKDGDNDDITNTLFIRQKRQKFLDELTNSSKVQAQTETAEATKNKTHRSKNVKHEEVEGKDDDDDDYDVFKAPPTEANTDRLYNTTKLRNLLSEFSKNKKKKPETTARKNVNDTIDLIKSDIKTSNDAKKINMDDTAELQKFKSHKNLTSVPKSALDKLLTTAINDTTVEIRSLRQENRKLSRTNQTLETRTAQISKNMADLRRQIESETTIKHQLLEKVRKYKTIATNQSKEMELLKLQNELYKQVFDSLVFQDKTLLLCANISFPDMKADTKSATPNKTHDLASDNGLQSTIVSCKDEIVQKLSDIQDVIQNKQPVLANNTTTADEQPQRVSSTISVQRENNNDIHETIQSALLKYRLRKNIMRELSDLENDELLQMFDELANLTTNYAKQKQSPRNKTFQKPQRQQREGVEDEIKKMLRNEKREKNDSKGQDHDSANKETRQQATALKNYLVSKKTPSLADRLNLRNGCTHCAECDPERDDNK